MAWTILPGWLGAASLAYQTKREMNASAVARGGKKNKSIKNKNKRRNTTRRANH
jgi:hypothetical protein